jgi:sulfate permease, SulP family
VKSGSLTDRSLSHETYTRAMRAVAPGWLHGYRRSWLVTDVVAGVIVWSVVVPQAVAYAQIAGLPPSAGLIAAPGALLAYALLGTSRTLIVSATTATSALSAAAVGPLADGDVARFAALSAGLALVAAAVLAAAGFLRLGGVMDLVSKPVMTGFLFGLGLVVAVGQVPKLLGVDEGSGDFFPQLSQLIEDLGDLQGWTVAVGVISVALLVVLGRVAPRVPATLVVLAASIAVSALLDLPSRGVDVVGDLPSAVPDPSIPDLSWDDVVDLVPAALGVMIVTAEAVGVGRTLASAAGYRVDANRDLVAFGGSNLLAGLSGGFVQSGGASQTMAAERAGAKSQVTSLVAAGLVLLTGAFLAPLFKDLPQATLAAIVVVAIAGFWRVDELRRFAHVRPSALAMALVALAGVLLFGVLPGLLIAAGLSLVVVVQRLSRPSVGELARDPATAVWARLDRHPDWQTTPGILVARVDGPLFYANAMAVKERLLALARAADPARRTVVLELAESPDLDMQSLDMLAELADELGAAGAELRLASVRTPALELLRRSGLADRVRIEPTLDAAVS